MAENEEYDVTQHQDGNAPVTHLQYRALRMHFQRQLDMHIDPLNTSVQHMDLQITELQQSINEIKAMLEGLGQHADDGSALRDDATVNRESADERAARLHQEEQARRLQQAIGGGRGGGRGNLGGRGGGRGFGDHRNGAYAEERHDAAYNRMGYVPHHRDDDGLGKPKFTIPTFTGSTDVEEYLNWELKMDKLFRMHEYTEDRKIKLAASEFDDYALPWWENVVQTRVELGELPIVTWAAMKREMRSRFVPRNYTRTLYDKLQNLKQGTASVDEYHQEMELIMQRARVREAAEQTMQRFLSGLNFGIKRIVRHYPYTTISELLHQAREAESQLAEDAKFAARTTAAKSRFTPRADSGAPSSGSVSGFRGSSSRQPESSVSNAKQPSRPAASAASSAISTGRNRDIICHQCKGAGHMKRDCPSLKTMLINANGEFETDDEAEDPCDDDNPESTVYADAANVSTIICTPRVLSVVPKPAEEQRCNLFQTKAIVAPGKACKVIIDGGSCHNLASKELCLKLKLKYLPHPNPYYIQWLSDHGEMKISHMVRVNFQIGPYQDTVECDVVPMTVCHLLLGRPWQSDRRVRHDG